MKKTCITDWDYTLSRCGRRNRDGSFPEAAAYQSNE